jgi:hypothetical protein
MTKIHYKSDFMLSESFKDVAGSLVLPGMLNFSIVYKTKGWANYVVSHRDGTCTNCIISDNSLTVIFQDHNLPVGQLSRELHIYNENELFQSGIQHVVFYSEPNIYLTERDSDPATVLSEEVLANILLLQPTTPQEPEVPGVINLDSVRSVMFTLNAQTQTLQRWLTIFHEAYNANRLKHNSYDANILQLQTLVQNVVSISNFQSLSNAIVEQFETIRTEILKTQPPAHTHYRNTILSKTARIAISAEHPEYELPDVNFADTFTCSLEIDTTLKLPDIPLGMSYEINLFNFSQSNITVTFMSQYAEHIFNASVVLSPTSMTHLIIKRFNYYLTWEGTSSSDFVTMLFIVNYAAITDPSLPQSLSLMSEIPSKPEEPKSEDPEPPCPYFFNPNEFQGSVDFAGRKWITQHAWGVCHPGKPNSHYSNDAVFVDREGILHLTIIEKPIQINVFDTETQTHVNLNPRYAIGLVTCCDVFTYGKFTFVAKLPRGPRLWPSIWLYDADTWPPELDLFEGYSNRFGGYFNILTSKFSNTISDSFKLAFKGINPSRTRSLLNWCLEPNLSNTDGHTKPYNNFSNWSVLDRLRRPDKDFVEYTLDWRKIKFVLFSTDFL